MSEGRLSDYLEYMAKAATNALAFVEGLSVADFLSDERTQQAVVMSLLIIGEAATKVMNRHPGFAADHPNIGWRSMRGMRNRIAHGYFDINLDVVWETVQTELPGLLEEIKRLG